MKKNNTVNLSSLISRHANLKPDGMALCMGTQTYSYRQLDVLVWKATKILHDKGVKKSDVLAQVFDDEVTLIIMMLATARLGATVFSLDKSSSTLLGKEMIHKVSAKFIVTDVEDVDFDVEKIPINKTLLSRDDITIDESLEDTQALAPWIITSGSGTTGSKKLIPITHAQMLSRLFANKGSMDIGQDDKLASLVGLEFFVGKMRCLDAFYCGAAYQVLDKKHVLPKELITREGITILYGTVFHIENILRSYNTKAKEDFKNLKVLAISASTVSDDLRARIARELNSNLHVMYGANELSPISVFKSGKDVLEFMSVGKPAENVLIEVVDKNGVKLGQGKTGQIRIKSAAMIDSYLDDEEATEQAFKEGWFYPGDLGRFSEDGQLIYCGREDHMMIMDGINIYPAEIEALLTQHTSVLDAAAMPMRHPVHQDIPVCAIVLHKDATVSVKELMDFSYQGLGSSGPKEIVLLDQIPRNEQGKLIRTELAQFISQKLEVRREQSKKTILVMFSGGLDSTFMLYHYLKNTDYKIHVHHISLRYPSEPRWQEEDISSRRIVEYCRKIRSFDYSESRVDIGFYKYVGRDSDTQMLMASKVAPNIKGQVAVALGWQYSDYQEDLLNGRAQNRVTERLWEVLCESMGEQFSRHVSREILLPLVEMKVSKKEMIQLCPKELVALTWSCRRPKRDEKGVSRPCGECHPCKEIKEAVT